MKISREEFTYLKTIEKHFLTQDNIKLGPPPLRWEREITAPASKDFFHLNFYRGSVEMRKYVYNKTYRKAIVLGRLCSMGRHTNPDGTAFNGTHFHVYDENFGDKIAYPVSELDLEEDADIVKMLEKFLQFFNVTNVPSIQTSLLI